MLNIPNYLAKKATKVLYQQVRHSKAKPFMPILKKRHVPVLYYSFEERQKAKAQKWQDEEKFKKIDIGFSASKLSDNLERRKKLRELKNDLDLEKQARECTLKVDIPTVERDWGSSTRLKQIKVLAEHYGIFKDLFGNYAFFYPIVHLNLFYDYHDGTASPVAAGNLLKPAETSTVPSVEFESEPESYWSLILTNPDGNLFDNDSEILHWFVGNIPGGSVSDGEEIVDYMRPIPPKGTGFHRFCFVLYKQTEKIDFSQYKRKLPCLTLKQRTFKTYDFYKKFEDVITPAGLSWFQADYDSSLTDFFHHTLEMKEPSYEYEFPKPYIKPQELFPFKRDFNRYLDLHRDPKETQKLMLLKRLERVHPFQGEKPLHPFPQALPVPRNVPIWIKNELQYERDGVRQYRHMYRGDDRPYVHRTKPTFPFNKLKH